MGHDHSYNAHHHLQVSKIKKAFVVGIVLNLGFVIVEVLAGLWSHSLSLIADAGHNLADVGTLSLSLLAFKLSKTDPTEKFTYGFGKISIMVALINSMVLMFSVGVIAYEAIQRFYHPQGLAGQTVAVVAGVGILVNTATALLFFKEKDQDINIKSSYLHLMADALVSLVVVMGGVIIIYTSWFWVDSALGIMVALVILLGSWQVLKESIMLSMDRIPYNVQFDKVREEALRVTGVKDLYHIHIWALSTNQNAMTAHLVLKNEVTPEEEYQIKHLVKHSFKKHNIHHITLETEREHFLARKDPNSKT